MIEGAFEGSDCLRESRGNADNSVRETLGPLPGAGSSQAGASTTITSLSQVSPRKRSYCSARRRSASRPGGSVDVVVGDHLVLRDVAAEDTALDEPLGQVATARSSRRRATASP